MRLIDADSLYEQIAKKEELARQRVLDTPSWMPNGNFNPSSTRYAAQLDERIQMKIMIANAPTIELIRCKDCKHRPHKNKDGYTMPPRVQVGVYAWGEPEYDDDETCPYVCEDRWYSRIPNDEQYCDRAEPKEADE